MAGQNDDYLNYLKNLLAKTSQATLGTGMDTQTADSIEPIGSPIDLIGGAAGAKLGGAMAADAGSVLGNEAGILRSGKVPGSRIRSGVLRGEAAAAAPEASFPESDSEGIVKNFRNYLQNTTGKGAALSPEELKAAANQIDQQAAAQNLTSPVNLDTHKALQSQIDAKLAQQTTSEQALDEAKKKALASLAGQ